MDSIMKNIGGEYVDLFSRNIVQLFCKSFEKLVCLYMCVNWEYYMQGWENVYWCTVLETQVVENVTMVISWR